MNEKSNVHQWIKMAQWVKDSGYKHLGIDPVIIDHVDKFEFEKPKENILDDTEESLNQLLEKTKI